MYKTIYLLLWTMRLRSNCKALFRASWVQTLLTVVILSSLLVLSTILGGVVQITDTTVDSLEEKLWFYFYLNESIDEEVGASVLLALTQDLKSIGLNPVYYSKEQAFERLARSLPNVIDDLAKYDIENPLPPTLYVPFSDRESYELLRNVLLEYDDFITNSEELNSQIVFGDQEKRIQSVLSVSHTIQRTIIAILCSIVLIMAACIAYGNRAHLLQFAQQLWLEKLLWASWIQRALPFFCWTWMVSIFAISGSGVVIAILLSVLTKQLTYTSDSAFQTILTTVDFWELWLVAWGVLFVLSTIVTQVMMMRKHV